MRNILGVIGSPRKNGNTHVLVSRILDGARDGGANVVCVSLAESRIVECDGCHACWRGKHECCKDDAMRDLYPKIIGCDVMVMGTPVYWYGPTAIMKAFVDRFVYFNCPENRRKIRGKAAVLAVPFEDRTLATSDLVVEFFERSLKYLEMRLVEKVLVPGVTARGEVRTRKRVMDRCYRLGQRLAAGPSCPA